jgi:type IV secretion system protein VirD4
MIQGLRTPGGKRVRIVLDEAGQLGCFEMMLRICTIGRAYDLILSMYYQSVGQVIENFGHQGLQTILASCQVRQFFGVRVHETAQMISDMLGIATLHFQDVRTEQQAAQDKAEVIRKIMSGEDFTEAAMRLEYLKHSGDACARPLMTPSEIMEMPVNEQLLFISGVDCPPILGGRIPYFKQKKLLGHFLPNPYHRPYNQVVLPRWHGRPIKRALHIENVPQELCHFPQYQRGVRAVIAEGLSSTSGLAALRRYLPR